MSDQDFFFDEEDEKPAASAKASVAKSGSAKQAAKAAPAKTAGVSSGGSFFDRDLNMGIASLLAVCALLVGLVAGILVGQARANSAVADITASDINNLSGGQKAPQLTQDQLNSGQLPAGHPAINNGSATASSATGK